MNLYVLEMLGIFVLHGKQVRPNQLQFRAQSPLQSAAVYDALVCDERVRHAMGDAPVENQRQPIGVFVRTLFRCQHSFVVELRNDGWEFRPDNDYHVREISVAPYLQGELIKVRPNRPVRQAAQPDQIPSWWNKQISPILLVQGLDAVSLPPAAPGEEQVCDKMIARRFRATRDKAVFAHGVFLSCFDRSHRPAVMQRVGERQEPIAVVTPFGAPTVPNGEVFRFLVIPDNQNRVPAEQVFVWFG